MTLRSPQNGLLFSKMKPWLIQSSGLILGTREEKLLSQLKNKNVPVRDFGVIPFVPTITGCESFADLQIAFVHCSTKALRLVMSNSAEFGLDAEENQRVMDVFKSGMFYNEHAFDFATYHKVPALRDNKLLLNYDAKVMPAKSFLHQEVPYDVFCKPTKDLKMFNGGIIEAGQTLLQMVNQGLMDASFMSNVNAGETVLIALPKEVYDEFRFFVLDGEVLAWSKYMSNGSLNVSNSVPASVIDAAKEYARLYEPARAFVMDLCTTDDGIKIVEYNCMNCSGVYDADLSNLIDRFETLT